MLTTEKYISNPLDPFVINLDEEFDKAYFNKDISKIRLSIDKAEMNKRELDLLSQAKLCYSLGTSYGDIASLDEAQDTEKNLEMQLFYLQKSIQLIPSLDTDNPILRPWINSLLLPLYTNYANVLEKCGRKSKAIEFYHLALNVNPDFSMAIGNAGVAYYHYAIVVPDSIHSDYINHFAYHYLKKAIKLGGFPEPKVKEIFTTYIENYDLDYEKEKLIPPLNIPQFTYPEVELNYRNWALKNKLFLNPLNDLPVSELCFAADVLHLPNMVVNIDEKPVLHGLYNQLKQEYIFVRHLLYETLEAPTDVHYADKDTYLLQFADYPLYSIRCEKLKTVFRISYSLLDKVAFFINNYFKLGIKERDINFRSIWKLKKEGRNSYEYRNVLEPEKNYFLNSLYWISKELFDTKEFSTNPRAEELNKLRNSLEHKYVKIYSEDYPVRNNGEIDDLAIYLSENRLKMITLDLLKLTREVLINLSLAVNMKEIQNKSFEEHVIPTVGFLKYEDEWKL